MALAGGLSTVFGIDAFLSLALNIIPLFLYCLACYYTPSKFQLALADAQSLATGLDHQLIEPVHVMVALLDQEGGASRHLLTRAPVTMDNNLSKILCRSLF